MKFTWLGHSAILLDIAGKTILIDPFLAGNPMAPSHWPDLTRKLDAILITHGHSDHIADAPSLAKKTGATCFANWEICQYLSGEGIEKLEPMNTGGSVRFDDLTITMVRAFHSSSLESEAGLIAAGDSAGFVIQSAEGNVYHAGDTDLFSDMKLIQDLYAPSLGFLPIGDRFTMGPKQAAYAANYFLALDHIVPIHHSTFGLLTGTPDEFAPLVKKGQVLTPQPGEEMTLSLAAAA